MTRPRVLAESPDAPRPPFGDRVRRWVPLLDRTTYVMALAMLAATWIGWELVLRLLAYLRGVL